MRMKSQIVPIRESSRKNEKNCEKSQIANCVKIEKKRISQNEIAKTISFCEKLKSLAVFVCVPEWRRPCRAAASRVAGRRAWASTRRRRRRCPDFQSRSRAPRCSNLSLFWSRFWSNNSRREQSSRRPSRARISWAFFQSAALESGLDNMSTKKQAGGQVFYS